MRLFVAIFPPPEAREALSKARSGLRVKGETRWTRPENIHLTLKFLGEVPEETTKRITDALKEIAKRHATFDLTPSDFGGFPSERKARVIWAGMDGEVNRLRALAKDVEDALEAEGFEREKREFSPHLTLGRARKRPVSLEVKREAMIPGFEVKEMRLVK
ncbi:MAG: RNA 2',3'-cyclic phosphodiesterase, partial [Rubrobacteraceae bacterium]